jgi:hypothetical protein
VGVRLIHAKSGARSTRYLERGLEAALTDDPRLKPPKLLDAKQEAAIVALVCGHPPPPGRARWTIVPTAQEAQRRGVVHQVGRETIRRLFVSHELKPWRERNDGSSSLRPSLKDEILLSL